MAQNEYTPEEIEELEKLCKELLKGADKCCAPPHYIVQPFVGIVIRHSKLINKFNLMGDIPCTKQPQ